MKIALSGNSEVRFSLVEAQLIREQIRVSRRGFCIIRIQSCIFFRDSVGIFVLDYEWCGSVGPPHTRKLDWTNTGCILGERTARTDFQTRFIGLCDSVRHSIEASNGRVWLVSALDQVVRGAEMVSDRDTAQPGSPHVLVVSISLGRS